jgi:hypothetical protein
LNMPLVSPASATSRGAARRSSQPAVSEAAAVETPTAYGIDRDGVPFALRSDGTKGRFLNLSSKTVKIEILKGTEKAGKPSFGDCTTVKCWLLLGLRVERLFPSVPAC